ncbi:LAMI_0B02168g1_1 [Lachancea mirantina]|uniref:Protein BZZ1 n=1 Tax=Lachancea mirantina TaxID=1230905 RepID=A0A1G4IUG8_9SACH|nr:LAMI_0B02168g1_1 [Lachancea mirantina]
MTSEVSIGNSIKDGYKETHKWVINNLKWLNELEAFYRDRAKLEKEYSDKLSNLTSEYFAKKSSGTVALSVGDTPSTTPGSLESASLVAWNEILSQTETIAKDHSQLAQEFEFQVADQLVALGRKCDSVLTTINGFNSELTERKDKTFGSLEKAKKSYDESCSDMESARAKQTKSTSDKAQRKADHREHDMNVAKNNYLIKINQANRLKDKYYFQDVPEVLDLLQDLNECKTSVVNQIWVSASTLEKNLGKRIETRLTTADSVVHKNSPPLDSSMFIEHNLKHWDEPKDFTYIPSAVWHDDEQFVVASDVELQDLKIRLAKAQQAYEQMDSIAQQEMSKLSSLNKQKHDLKKASDVDYNSLMSLLSKYLTIISSFTNHETSKLDAEVEISSIQNNVPAGYDLSTEGIDLSKLKKKGGFFGKLRKNLTVSSTNSHVKNEDTAESASVFSSDSKHKALDRFSVFKRRARGVSNASALSSTLADDESFESQSTPVNRVLYAYEKQDVDELTVRPGDAIKLISSDSGNGWTKIRNESSGQSGLVPTTYVEIHEKAREPPRAPLPRKTVNALKTVTALYDYQAQGEDEISLAKNDTISVIRADDGSGWTYGENTGNKGLFPTSYCS